MNGSGVNRLGWSNVRRQLDSLGHANLMSPFHWYAPSNPLVHGASITGFLLLAGCTAALAVAGVVTFDRRDIGT